MDCPKCGSALGSAGYCAACLLAGGLSPTDPAATRATPLDTIPSHPLIAPFVDALAESDLSADHFGPYEIQRVLGEGGMGTVYLARQTHPIDRLVALKVVKPGMDSARILARFEYERQTVARMDHPNIARVYDASATRKGRPFFVMEYVEGEPITAYCDRRRLSTRQRLALFLPVCQAVQHAHLRGILHRDIKPSNVLITEVDGQPVPKIIDFGIAKALDHSGFDRTAFTEFGQFVGTPEYMSPESVDPGGGDVDTSSDVYSLGVLLYELLVGAVPFDVQSLRLASLLELFRIIREEDAPPLTRKLTLLGASAADIAARRGTDPVSLKREVTGDLNAIVLKAVEKQRGRRYSTPSEFVADLEALLAHRPVSAASPSAAYRLGKFVRRHRGSVIAAAAVAAALLIGLIGTLTQARQAMRERAIAVQERATALRQRAIAYAERASAGAARDEARAAQLRAESATAQALAQQRVATAALSDVRQIVNRLLFDFDKQLAAMPASTDARRNLVDLGVNYLNRAASYDGSFSDPTLGSAYLRMGRLHNDLLQFSEGRESLDRAQTILEKQLIRNPRDRVLRRELAETLLVRSSGDVESFALMNARRRRAAAILSQLLREDPKDWQALSLQSTIDLFNLDYDRAIASNQVAYDLSAQSLREFEKLASSAFVFHNYLVNRDSRRAVRGAEEWIARVEKRLAELPSHVGLRLLLSDFYSILGDAQITASGGIGPEYLTSKNKAIEIARTVMEQDPRSANAAMKYAQHLQSLAFLQMQLNLSEDALRNTERSAAAMRDYLRRFPNSQPILENVHFVYTSLSGFYVQRGDIKKAMELRAESLRIASEASARDPRNASLGRAHANSTMEFASALSIARSTAEARKKMEEAEALSAALVRHRPLAMSLLTHFNIQTRHAQILRAAGLHEEAIRKASEAVVTHGRAFTEPDWFGDETPPIGAYFEMVFAHQSRLEWAQARELTKRIVSRQEANLRRSPGVYYAVESLANALDSLVRQSLALGDHDSALQAADRAVQVAESSAGADPADTRRRNRWYMANLSRISILRSLGRRQEALAGIQAIGPSLLKDAEATPPRLTSQSAIRLNLASQSADVLQAFRADGEALKYLVVEISGLEKLMALQPGSLGFRRSLSAALGRQSESLLRLNRLPETRESMLRQLQTHLQLPVQSAEDQRIAGLLHARIAAIEQLLGKEQDAQSRLAQARGAFVESYEKDNTAARTGSASMPALLNTYYSALNLMLLAESSGDRKAAQEWARLCWQAGEQRLKSDARNRLYRSTHDNALAIHRYLSGEPLPDLEAARALRTLANRIYDLGAWLPFSERWSALALPHASRAAATPSAESQIELAYCLAAEARNLLLRNVLFADTQNAARHRQALAHYQRVTELLSPLEAAKALPTSDEQNLLTDARLQTANLHAILAASNN